MHCRALGRRGWIVLMWVVIGGLIAVPTTPATGLTLCPTGGPGPGDPHPGPAVPFIGGTVSDGNGQPIDGANIHLTRCVLGVPTTADVQATASDGSFAFVNLMPGATYVVHAPLDGVLAGLVPSSDTLNPSWAIQGSHGDDHVDMVFE